jgi:hypothetical protein
MRWARDNSTPGIGERVSGARPELTQTPHPRFTDGWDTATEITRVQAQGEDYTSTHKPWSDVSTGQVTESLYSLAQLRTSGFTHSGALVTIAHDDVWIRLSFFPQLCTTHRSPSAVNDRAPTITTVVVRTDRVVARWSAQFIREKIGACLDDLLCRAQRHLKSCRPHEACHRFSTRPEETRIETSSNSIV